MDKIANEIIETRWFDYHRIGYDQRLLELKAGGSIGAGSARCESDIEGQVFNLPVKNLPG